MLDLKKERLLYADFGVFLCAGLLKTDKIKELIKYLSMFGYTSLRWEVGMYVDVNDEIKSSLGSYTHDEIKEIDDYAFSQGIELIPCVQCFKHSGSVTKFEKYKDIIYDGYLSPNEDGTYELLKNYFLLFKKLFRTNKIHIGLDETFDLGGKEYTLKYGYEECASIYYRHVKKVYALAKECGYQVEMWGDMIKQYTRDLRAGIKTCTKNYLTDFPSDLKAIEWFYGGNYDKTELDKIFGCYDGVKSIAYCDCARSYVEYIPHNLGGINTYQSHIDNMKDYGISTYLVSIWNDYDSCSLFSVLPALFTCSLFAHGYKLNEEAKECFYELCKVHFDDFMLLDLINKDDEWPVVFIKDIFEGSLFAKSGRDDIAELQKEFKEYADKLKKIDGGDFSLIFDSIAKFADAMCVKTGLAEAIITAYENNDIDGLKKSVDLIDEFLRRLNAFETSFFHRCESEFINYPNKTNIARIGNIREDCRIAKMIIEDYLNSKINCIVALQK